MADEDDVTMYRDPGEKYLIVFLSIWFLVGLGIFVWGTIEGEWMFAAGGLLVFVTVAGYERISQMLEP